MPNPLGVSDVAYMSLSPAERQEAETLNQENMQHHHDWYLALSRGGRITENQKEDLALAQLREAKGEVLPLEEGAEIEILRKHDYINDPDRDYGD